MGLQRGATLVIGLIILVLITLIVVNAFTLSSSGLKSVGNMQVREEAVAAAARTLEVKVSAPFYDSLAPESRTVDINNDGVNDYSVVVATPVCIGAKTVSDAAPSDVELPVALQSGAEWNTDWEMIATVSDLHGSGAAVTMREGVRVRMSQSKKDTACPQPANRSSP
jgi:hypothetical protein